jgi:hypothetical protein
LPSGVIAIRHAATQQGIDPRSDAMHAGDVLDTIHATGQASWNHWTVAMRAIGTITTSGDMVVKEILIEI